MTQDEAIALIKSGKNVFVTGGAGVGKSHVIKQIADKNTLVCAPTGIAALNVGGILHTRCLIYQWGFRHKRT